MKILFAETDEQLKSCYPALKELRPHLEEKTYLDTMRIMMQEGVKVAMVEDDGSVPTVTCFRIAYYLFRGKNLYIDDLVTLPGNRGKGYGAKMLDWIKEYALSQNCDTMHLDSGPARHDAHRLYLNKGFVISSHHFSMNLKK
ncbi:MAG TPA: GNAT family N-acetyltransferase [Bacteroidia bacterium]|nr:GNAT family N-acetyltransferase [Bacteroidia bacterium]